MGKIRINLDKLKYIPAENISGSVEILERTSGNELKVVFKCEELEYYQYAWWFEGNQNISVKNKEIFRNEILININEIDLRYPFNFSIPSNAQNSQELPYTLFQAFDANSEGQKEGAPKGIQWSIEVMSSSENIQSDTKILTIYNGIKTKWPIQYVIAQWLTFSVLIFIILSIFALIGASVL